MSWWNRIFGRRAPAEDQPPTPGAPLATADDLFEALSRARESEDPAALVELCSTHRDRIVAAIPTWQKPPEAVRADPQALQRWVNTLMTVATTFKQVLGDTTVIELLSGDSPFARWEQNQQRAVALCDEHELEQAIALLEPDVQEMRGMKWGDNEAPFMLSMGLLGQLLYLSGQAERAMPLLEEVFDRLNAKDLADDAAVYTDLLRDARRYLGPVDGEPLLCVKLRIGDRLYGPEASPDLPVGEAVQGIFVRGRPTLPRAGALTVEGRGLAEAGDLDGAMERFERAAAADPLDPDSRYQWAFALLGRGEIRRSIELQEEVERLAPGWFDNAAWLRLSRRIEAGEIPQSLVGVLHQLDDGRLEAEERLTIATTVLPELPRVGQLHLHRGKALRELGRTQDAEVSYRAGLEVTEEDPHTHSQILAQLAAMAPAEEKRHWLEQLDALDGASLLTRALASVLLRGVDETS